MKFKILMIGLAWVSLAGAKEKLIIVNEGLWQSDNGSLTYFEDGNIVSNQWFRDINGKKLGDTPNDIIQVRDGMIAVAVNWSNIIQFMDTEGHDIGATEDVPNNRKLATDGNYVYVTSYAHEVGIDGGTKQFEKGYVAKIDCSTLKVTDAVEVGYEPEGIAWYRGYLFVANSGGYAFQEDHEYETTVSVIDAETMRVIRCVDTGQINLYGKMSQSGRYLCINSPGDYYNCPPATIILDCEAALEGRPDSDCVKKLAVASTANCKAGDGSFYSLGASYSYNTGAYVFNCSVIHPGKVFAGEEDYSESLPGTLQREIEGMSMPYGIYVNPYTGYIYATDAGEYAGAGALYQWSPEGQFLGKYKTYINPGHFLALGTEEEMEDNGIEYIGQPTEDSVIFDMTGIRVTRPVAGRIYIKNGKKFIFQ